MPTAHGLMSTPWTDRSARAARCQGLMPGSASVHSRKRRLKRPSRKVGAADALAAGGGAFVGVGTPGLAVCMYLSVREDKA